MKNLLSKRLAEAAALQQAVMRESALLQTVADVGEKLVQCYRAGGKVWFAGNGGSAAEAQHLAAELSGRFYYDRAPLFSEALHVNTSYLTAVANDYGYEWVFSRLIAANGSSGDILVGLSTSGNSVNIVKAFEVARERGVITVGMTGQGGGKMAALSDSLIAVPSTDTPRIQEIHLILGHLLCEYVESQLFPRG